MHSRCALTAILPSLLALATLPTLSSAQQAASAAPAVSAATPAAAPVSASRNPFSGLPGGLAALQNYRAMRTSSEDRPGNADFLRVAAGETTTIAQLEGPGEITHFWTTINAPDPDHLRKIIFRIYWDGNDFPSVEAPIGDFYGLGHAKYYYFDNPVQAIGTDRGMNAFWSMPFAKSARVEITNESDQPIHSFYYYVDWRKFDTFPSGLAYFHSQYRQEHPTVSGRNYLFCETSGGPGHYVGVSLSIHTQVEGWWGEGDDIITIDGEERPSIWGTGSEDYFSGAWGFGKEFYTDYFGMPLRTKLDHSADNYWNVYRLHLESPITFAKSIKVEMEHGDNGVSNRRGGKNNNYSSVAYYYVATPQRLLGKLPPAAERLPSFTPPMTAPGVFEAQYMARTVAPKGELSAQGMTGYSPREWLNGDHLFRSREAAEGEATELTFNTTETLTGEGALLLTMAPDYGQISIELDGKLLRDKVDLYSTEVEPVVMALNGLNLPAGQHTLKIKIVGKNEKSENYYWGLDYLRIGATPPEAEGKARKLE